MRSRISVKDIYIGPELDYSGAYKSTAHPELQRRYASNREELVYSFTTRYGQSYYITDKTAVAHIQELLEAMSGFDELDRELGRIHASLTKYLYELVVAHRGVLELLKQADLHVADERNAGYKAGKKSAIKKMREALEL